MRILYVITLGETGGAQAYVKTLAEAASARGHEVTVATGQNNAKYLKSTLEPSGAKIWPLEHLVRQVSPFHDCMAVWELAKLYQTVKPDVIHLNSSKAGVVGSFAAFLSRLSNKPKFKLIYTVHGWVFNEPMPAPLRLAYLILEKLASLMRDKLICICNYDRQIGLKRHIVPPDKLITIYNGVNSEGIDLLPRDESRFALGLSELTNELVLGTISNFYPAKDLNSLLEAVSMLKNQDVVCRLVIIGEGDLRSQLEQQIKKLKLEHLVILTGSKPAAVKYLKSFDIAVMSSVKEGLPFFPLEAMSASLPLVTTNVGGLPEIIEDGVTGYTVPARQPAQLAEKIKLLAENEALRKSFGAAGLKRVKEKFSQTRMLEETFLLYN